jgi:hypothetical protein
VNIVPALPAALAGAFVLFVPGLVLLALLDERDRRALRIDEALFLACALSVSLSSWLGLLLAELGRFSLLTAAALLAGVSGLLALACRRRLGLPFERPVAWRSLLPALLVLALALVLQARPSQYIVGGRDPGAYVASMALIGRSGGIQYVDPAVLSIPREDVEVFFRNADREAFSFSRFMGFFLERPESGRVVPQFFHLFPAFGAYLFQAMGVKGALATPPLLGILGTLAVYFALRRIFSPAVALLAALLLGANVIEVWFSRYPVSEPFSQLLTFLALFAVAFWEERASGAFAAIAGAALGLSLMVRVDSVLIVVPVGLYVLIRLARGDLGWRGLLPLLLPFFALGVHAALHAQLFANKYVQDIVTRRYWRQPVWVWVLLALLALIVLAAAEPLGRRLRPWFERHAATLRGGLIAALIVAAAYAYFLRPRLSAWAGGDGNVPQSWATNFATLDADNDDRLSAAEFARRPAGGTQALFAHLDRDQDGALRRAEWKGDPPWPLDTLGFQRLAAHDAQSLYRLGWFVSPLGLLLGVLGLALAIREFRSRYLFPLLLALTFSFFYLYKIRVWNDYYFALRRFVPVVLPFLLAFAALVLVRLARRGGLRRVAAAACATLLAFVYAGDTRRIAPHVDWNGSVDFVRALARRFTPEDVVVFEQPRSIHLLSLPLWSAHGVNVLELARFNPDPGRLQHLIRAWRQRYNNIYFVHTYSTDLCGVFLQRSEAMGFETLEWERTETRPPRRPETRALYFTISRVLLPEELQVPALDELDVGGSDDFQVSGFFDKEGGGERSYRWTGPCGTLYLPGARPGATLTLLASVGRRPDAPEVQVSLSGVALGAFTPRHDWGEHSLRLPDPLPPGPALLRLDVKAFRPKNVDAFSDDTRELGVMIDRVRLRVEPRARATMRAPTDGGAR